MINTFLFDLDGTLLPVDMDKFLQVYFDEMGKTFSDLIEPEKLFNCVWAATEAMIKNVEYRTNEEVFMEKFAEIIGDDIEVFRKRFDLFYENGFLKTRDCVECVPIIKEGIEMLKNKGYELVIATNPIFPRKAIIQRIKWAGLDPDYFSYISFYERNHFCKPQLEFYEEILRDIGKQPHECIMVGNDVQEDMIASCLGIKTFLITNYMIHRTDDEIACTYSGTYEDFYRFVEKLNHVTTLEGPKG